MSRDGDLSLIRASDLFDVAWYLELNSDVAAAGIDPIIHYYEDGAREGRDPCKNFCTKYYLERYPDVAQSGTNPLIHFITVGRDAGRSSEPDLYWKFRKDPSNQADYQLIEDSGLFDKNWYIHEFLGDHEFPPDPIAHYFIVGSKEGFPTGSAFETEFYLRNNPDVAQAKVNPLVHYIVSGRLEGRLPIEPKLSLTEYIETAVPQRKSVRMYNDKGSGNRIYLVTETLNRKYFFGGVGTSLIVATMLAAKRGASITILVKDDESDLSLYNDLLLCHNIGPPINNVEIINITKKSAFVPYRSTDVFITTSWWTTCSMLNTVPSKQVWYLLQDDERLFYSHGNMHLLISEILNSSDIEFIVNTQLLHSHLLSEIGADFGTRSCWFEPAFPEISYYPEQQKNSKLRFVFYARGNSDRNLFVRGLEIIDRCLASSFFDSAWEIVFLGSDIPRLEMPFGRDHIALQNLTWSQYLTYIRTTDLALSLMYSPHPSYPPLDVAACGGVAVTNTFGCKTNLAQYSNNIICRNTNLSSLVEGVYTGIQLATNQSKRVCQFNEQRLERDWSKSLYTTLSKLA